MASEEPRALAKPSQSGFTANHAKRLAWFMAAGGVIFLVFLFALQVALILANVGLDATFYRFYPIMAAVGAAFGFERWWGQEQGEYNPFHE